MKRIRKKQTLVIVLAILSLALATAGCGGSGGGGVVNCLPEVSSGSLSGNAYTILRSTGVARPASDLAADNTPEAARAASAGEAAATSSVYMPIKNVTITCGDQTATTDENGRFSFNKISVSMKECRATKTGYLGVAFSVDIKPGMETTVNLSQDVFMTPTQSYSLSVVTNAAAGNVVYIDGSPVYNAGNTIIGFSVAAGTHEIVVSATGYEPSATTTVDVSTAAATATITLNKLVTSIAVAPGPASYDVGATQQFTATCTYYDGTSAACTNDVTWQTDNTAVTTIDAAGLATTVGGGSINVTATRVQSNASGSSAMTVTGLLLDRTCSDATGVCLDLVGASTNAGANVTVSVVITSAPPSGVLGGELTFDWGTGMTLNTVTAGTGVEVDSQNISVAAHRVDATYTTVAPYTSVLSSGTTIATFQFTTDAAAGGQIPVAWATTDDLTDLTDGLLTIWNQGTFTLRNGYVNITPGTARMAGLR